METLKRYSELKSLLALVGETATFACADDNVFVDRNIEDPNFANAAGETPLSVVITWNDLTAVKILVSAGADVNRRMWHGHTPLHDAASRGSAEIVKYLLEHGASPDAVNDLGMTPMDFARAKYPAIMDLLDQYSRIGERGLVDQSGGALAPQTQ